MITVRPATPADVDAIVTWAEEKDRFYGVADVGPRTVRREQVTRALFADRADATALVAWRDDQLAGLAAYSYLWPARGVTRSLFLKELYVLAPARRTGVGGALMRAVFRTAEENGCSRVEWQTDVANPEARAFYARLGAAEFDGKVCYRIELATSS